MSKQSVFNLLLIVFISVLSGLGYGLYLLYPRFDLPVVMGIPLIILAAGAGLASFFSPCSFPLLLTLLARQGDSDVRSLGPWRFAMGLSTGAGLFLIFLGGFFLAGGMALSRAVTFGSMPGIVLRLLMGMFLVWLGGVQLGWVSDRAFRWLQQSLAPGPLEDDPRRSTAGLVGYGFGYVLAGFG